MLATYVLEDSSQQVCLADSLSTPPRKKSRGPITPTTDEGYVSRTSFVFEEIDGPVPEEEEVDDDDGHSDG
jgi:hypothetical protein